jgi:hypothetical protein
VESTPCDPVLGGEIGAAVGVRVRDQGVAGSNPVLPGGGCCSGPAAYSGGGLRAPGWCPHASGAPQSTHFARSRSIHSRFASARAPESCASDPSRVGSGMAGSMTREFAPRRRGDARGHHRGTANGPAPGRRGESWVQSLGCWEPDARVRHDSLLVHLRARVDARRPFRRASGSRIGAREPRTHSPERCSTSRGRDLTSNARAAKAASLYAVRDWLRIIRRAEATRLEPASSGPGASTYAGA